MQTLGREFLFQAWERGSGIGAFTTYTLESTRAICEAAEELAAPVIIQAGASSFRGVGRELLAGAALGAAAASRAEVGVHLDHATDVEEIRACIALGYSSVMIDASQHSFEENVTLTSSIVREGHDAGVWVEAELGAIAGDEDASGALGATTFTSPEQAGEFAERTGVDALAVAIGNVHGMSEVPIHLDIALLAAIRAEVPIPLVLHGASGIADEELRAAVRGGMAKVNFNTELRRAYLSALDGEIALGGDDIIRVQRAAIDAVRTVVAEKIVLVR